MSKKLKTYRITGTIKSDYPIDVDTRINAYSAKQAKYKLVFDVIEHKNINVSASQLFKDVKRSRLSIIEE